MQEYSEQRLIIVTGLSGAGMSSALKAFEDIGYEVLDNFPLSLLDPLLAEDTQRERPVAVGIDARTRGFDPEAVTDKARDVQAGLVFLTCDSEILHRRFSETRRTHPLAGDRPVNDGIRSERQWLSPLQDKADLVIDTSHLSIHDLRREIEGHYRLEDKPLLWVNLLSFAYKHGLPREADIVMDVRFLRNPHWDKNLCNLTGHDERVAHYIREDASYKPFMQHFTQMMQHLLTRYVDEGKHYLTIAIGCTGGKHRSVHVAEALRGELAASDMQITVQHRDMGR
jgi:UPF0042 nucleotide-binding protein